MTLIDIRRPEEWTQTGVVEGSIKATAFDKQGRFQESFLKVLEDLVSPNDEFASSAALGIGLWPCQIGYLQRADIKMS